MTAADFRILIIDDNPSIHLDFQKILKTESISSNMNKLNKLIFGYNEKSAEDEETLPVFQIDYAFQGEEGISHIKQGMKDGNPYALAFVDIRMPPGLDGIETIKEIWSLNKDTQIVICTAFSDYTWEETIGQLGLTDNLLILKKPFDSIAVRQLACSLTKKWQLMQESKKREEILEKTIEERNESLKKSLSLLEYQATHDPLTTLPNRTLLMDRIKQEISRANRNHSMFALIFIDLDRFKLINDSFDHETGDIVLKMVTERLTKTIREEDTVARLGGDEFIIISVFSEVKKIENIGTVASKILATISEVIRIGHREIIISASLGVSLYPQDGTTAEKLIRNADLAMYRAKTLGGNQFQFYAETFQDQCLVRLEKESDLRLALLQHQFFLEYQPQYNIKTKQLIAVEALIRWNHPQKGTLLPMDFIPLAEETGLIIPIGEWIMETACQQNKTWQDKGISPFSVAVNVATKQFIQPNFISMVKNILEKTKLNPKYFEVEVTENVIINAPNVIDAINKLKKLGVRIILDDFGTGNTGLNYLHKLPISQLKIDQSFIQNIDMHNSDAIIVKAIISMAKSLHLDVIAEGIENKMQLKFLESQHCQNFQGFYFNKPMPAAEIEKLLLAKHNDQF